MVVTSYLLCPKVSISEITRQSRAVIAWLWQHAGEYHGDRNKIVVCGYSAGGQQVGMFAATDWPGEYGLPANIIRAGIPMGDHWGQARFIINPPLCRGAICR